ncbi:MAG: SDR family oxidoreductase, partial [Planctomycetes bacterium]|nr:SDR family oxidoreductase [Planctomycetota bacterium]
MHKQSLKNKICIVTGAAQNIGLGIATACIEAGATVIMLDHNEKLVSSEANKLGDKAFPMAIDLRDSTACDQIIKDIEQQHGRIDVVVNNAYKGYYQSLEKMTDQAWNEEIAIGLTAMMAICRAALPGMIQRGSGVFVNTGSINSFTPAYGMSAYATIKAGILNFTRQLAVEYGPQGIRANSVCPGYISNPEREKEFAEKPIERKRIEATIPLRQLGSDADVAEAVIFLASDSSRFITGHSLVVD